MNDLVITHPLWKTCQNPLCGDPFPYGTGSRYCCGMCEDEHNKNVEKV